MKRLSIFWASGPWAASEFCPLFLASLQPARTSGDASTSTATAAADASTSARLRSVMSTSHVVPVPAPPATSRGVEPIPERVEHSSPAALRASATCARLSNFRTRGGRARGRGAASRARPSPGSRGTRGRRAAPRAPRAPAVPASLSTAPPLPITIPFCDSRSTRIRARKRRIRRRSSGSSASASRVLVVVGLDLLGDHGDRVRQLVAGDREQLLAQQLGDEERLGLVGDHAVRVVARALRAAASRARRPARRRRRRCAPTAARTRRTRRARPSRPRGARRSLARVGEVDLVDHEDLRRVDLLHELGDEPVAAPDRRVRLDEQAHDVDLGERRTERARWCARRAACAACGCPACRAARSGCRAWCARRGSGVRVVCGRSETIATFGADEPVHQRRLPDVGPADEGDEARSGTSRRATRPRPAGRRSSTARSPSSVGRRA